MKTYRPCLLIILFAFFAAPVFSQNINLDLLKSINSKQTFFKDKYLELNASSVSLLSLAAPTAVFAVGLLHHDKQLQRDGLYMMGAYFVSGIITQSVKKITVEQRPFQKYSFIVQRDDESGGYSFPSGHTSAAFCTATSLALRFHKWYVIAPAYLFAGSVGWARMYQGVHYPSDVLAGALTGAGSAWLGWKLQHLMERKQQTD